MAERNGEDFLRSLASAECLSEWAICEASPFLKMSRFRSRASECGAQDAVLFLSYFPNSRTKCSEKLLTERRSKFFFDPPSTRSGLKDRFDDDGGEKLGSFLKTFFEIFGKVIDG